MQTGKDSVSPRAWCVLDAGNVVFAELRPKVVMLEVPFGSVGVIQGT